MEIIDLLNEAAQMRNAGGDSEYAMPALLIKMVMKMGEMQKEIDSLKESQPRKLVDSDDWGT